MHREDDSWLPVLLALAFACVFAGAAFWWWLDDRSVVGARGSVDDEAVVPRVWIEVEEVGRYVPPEEPRMVRLDRGDGERGLLESLQCVSDVDAAGGHVLAGIWTSQGRLLRRVQLRADGTPSNLRVGRRVTMRGRVATFDGAPIRNALVWAGMKDHEERTDADGSFAIAVRLSGEGIPVVIAADGWATQCRFVEIDAGSPPFDFRLQPECALTVRWVGPKSMSWRARAVVLPRGDQVTPALIDYPFFWQALVPVPFDEQGVAVVRGLPRGATIGVAARGPLLPMTEPMAVALREPAATASLGEGIAAGDVVSVNSILQLCIEPEGHRRSVVEDRWLLARADHDVGAVHRDFGRLEFDAQAQDGMVALPGTRGCLIVVSEPGDPTGARLLRTIDRQAHDVAFPWFTLGVDPHELRIPPPVAGTAWAVRIEPDREFTQVAADQPFVRAFAQPTLVNLRVRVAVDGATWSEPRVANELVVHGACTLPRELLQR